MLARLRAALRRYRKAVAPLLALLAQPAVLAVLHGQALAIVELIVAAAGAGGTIAAPPNAPKPTPADASPH